MVRSRDKGKRGEREAAAALRDLGFANARRGVQYQGGPDSPDVADAIPGVHLEVKRTKAGCNVHKAMAQADEERAEGEIPAVLQRRDHGEWLLTIRLHDIWKLYCSLQLPD